MCLECQSGYYLSKNKKCEIFPVEPVTNCKSYLSAEICSECQTGYFLENSTTCTENETIAECEIYNGSAPTTECNKCTNVFYLDGNTCSERVNSLEISECQKMNYFKDECETCNMNFVLNKSKEKCQRGVNNCIEYQSLTVETIFECIRCEPSHYLNSNDNICKAGVVPNCLEYETEENICSKCMP